MSITAVTAVLGSGFAYGASWVMRWAACETGTCPVAAAPGPLVVLMGAVAAWSAYHGTKERFG